MPTKAQWAGLFVIAGVIGAVVTAVVDKDDDDTNRPPTTPEPSAPPAHEPRLDDSLTSNISRREEEEARVQATLDTTTIAGRLDAFKTMQGELQQTKEDLSTAQQPSD
jgi:hypothetical protein